MLRTAKNSRLAQRVIPFQISYVAGAPVATLNPDEFSSITDNGTADFSLNFNDPFRRAPVCIASATTGVGATGAASYAITASITSGLARFLSRDTAGAGTSADGAVDGVIIGADSPTTHAAGVPQRLVCTTAAPRIVVLRLTSPSVITEGKYQATASAVSNRTTLTLKYPFQKPPVVLVRSDTTGKVANKVSATNSTVVIDQFDLSTDAASTNGLHVILIGQDSTCDTGRHRRALKATQLKPRIIAGRVTVAAGVYSIDAAYSDLGAVVKNGTGDFTLTFEKPFLRAPVIVATSTTGNAVAVTASSTTACTITTATSAGAAADASGDIQVLVIGFDYGVQS